jgi:hypothetical protein
MRRLAAAAIGLVMLTACGGGAPHRAVQRAQPTTSTSTTTTAPPTTTTTTTPPPTVSQPRTTTPTAPSVTPPSEPTTTTRPPTPPCCKGPDPVRWESYSVSSDGRSLTFKYWSGVDACSKFDHASVDESPSRVVVTIWERDVTNGNPCVAMAQEKFATVVLQAPLGNRTVVDGAA